MTILWDGETMTKEKYEVRGDGPYFIHDHDTGRFASFEAYAMITFRTRPEAEMFVEMLTRSQKGITQESPAILPRRNSRTYKGD